MSIYNSVNCLANVIAVNCSLYCNLTADGLFSSELSANSRKTRVRRIIWEKLLQKKNRALHQHVANKESTGVFILWEAFVNGLISVHQFTKCLQIVENMDENNIHDYLFFLLLLRKSPSESTNDPLRRQPLWRFETDESEQYDKDVDFSVKYLEPKIDWSEAENIPTGPYFHTWESLDCERRPSIKEMEANYDYWHRSRSYLGKTFSLANSLHVEELFNEVSFNDFYSALAALVMGCPSTIFNFNQTNREFTLNSNVCISGLSHDSLERFSQQFLSVAESFYKMILFLSAPIVVSPFADSVLKWYRAVVKRLVNTYLEKVILVSDEHFSEEKLFFGLSQLYQKIVQNALDIARLSQITEDMMSLIVADNPWVSIGFLFKEAISLSWQIDNLVYDQRFPLEQFLFGEVCNPLLYRVSHAVYNGLSNCFTLQSFGIIPRLDHLSARNLNFWLNGIIFRDEVITKEAVAFVAVMEAMVSAGRSVELLKICKPTHYLISMFLENAAPSLEFFPVDQRLSLQRYLSRHSIFRKHVKELRDVSNRQYVEMRRIIVMSVIEKIAALHRQLKERDDAAKASRLELQRQKLEQKKVLHELQLAETAARREAKAAAREQERQADMEIVRQLAAEDFTRTDYERRLLAEERERLVAYYADLERQADWRRAKAEWRTRRLQLTNKRLNFLESAKRLETMVFEWDGHSDFKAERAPAALMSDETIPNANDNALESILPSDQDESSEQDSPEHDNVKTENPPSDRTSIESNAPNPNMSPTEHFIGTAKAERPPDEEALSEEDAVNNSLIESVSSSIDSQAKNYETKTNETDLAPRNSEKTVDAEEMCFKMFDADRLIALQSFQDTPTSSLTKYISQTLDKVDSLEETLFEDTSMTFTQLFNKCLLEPALAISEMTNMAVVEYLRDELDIVGHLSALRRYLLLDAGEFAIAISLPIFEALVVNNKPEYGSQKDPVSAYFLESTLRNAIRYASSPMSILLAEERSRSGHEAVFSLQQDFAKKLKLVKTDAHLDPSKPFCFDALKMIYTVGWPLNIVLPPEDIVIYSKVFSFLLEIGRVLFILDGSLQVLEDCQQIAIKQAAIVDSSITLAALRHAHHTRSLMRFFFTSIQSYLSSHVLRPQWELLLKEVISANSLDDLRRAHGTYLKSLEKRCFLTDSTRPFRSILGRLIRCVLEFNEEIKHLSTSIVSDGAPVKKAQVAKIQAAANDFHANSAHFVSVAALRVSQYDRPGFLDRLLLQLTFNEFYASDISHDSSTMA